jgi:hypothetical protein
MRIVAVILGISGLLVVAFDSYESIILPRRVGHKVKLAKIFYRVSWTFWSMIGRKLRNINQREYFLSFYGPLSLIFLLIMWAALFILAFAAIGWGLNDPMKAPEKILHFGGYLYMSGTTFVTLGFGDITPLNAPGRTLAVLEGGTGMGFLAMVIGYLPMIYQTFSHREINISLLDARAGTLPSGPEMMIRHYNGDDPHELIHYLRDWEGWCAELLESHLSYPILAYYRSQHEGQSWVAALTAILDTCALILVGIKGIPDQPAKFIFAIARHAAVDLTQSFGLKIALQSERHYEFEDFTRLRTELEKHGIVFCDHDGAYQRLRELHTMYEPFVETLANYLMVKLPYLDIREVSVDRWQVTAWEDTLPPSPLTLNHTMRNG